MVENESRSDPLIGMVVHNYVVRSRLAEGGMGAVYLAHHVDPRSTAKKVIKILLPQYARHPVVCARFEQEAILAMDLRHPYVVKIDNLGKLPDGQPYLMMEYLDGETLEDHLQRRPAPCTLHHTLTIIAQLMSAVVAMHEAGYIHRDLKPANVFIVHTEQNPYEVRLIDLGIARNLAAPTAKRATMAGAAIGTPGYMAVEQYESGDTATAAADVYAVAVIAWRMLFGRLPWGNEAFDQRVLYFKQREEDFELPPNHGVPEAIIALLRKTLSKEPTDRPSASDFIAQFASETPAIPPFVKSGAQILDDVARRFLRNAAPHAETVRNVSHPAALPIVTPLSWPRRETQLPRLPSATPTAEPSPPAPTPIMAPTVSERPRAPSPPKPTTLGASSGVIDVPPAPRSTNRSRRIALAGAGALMLAGAATFAILHIRTTPSDGSRAGEPVRPASDPAATDAVETPARPAPVQIAPSAPTPSVPVQPSSTSASPAPTSGPTPAVADRPPSTTLQAPATTPRSAWKPGQPTSTTKRAPTAARTDAPPAVVDDARAETVRPAKSPTTAGTDADMTRAANPPQARDTGSGAQDPPKRFDPNAIIE